MQCAKLVVVSVIMQSVSDVWRCLHGDFESCNRSEAGGEGRLICLRFPAASPFERLTFRTKTPRPGVATFGASCPISSTRCRHLAECTYVCLWQLQGLGGLPVNSNTSETMFELAAKPPALGDASPTAQTPQNPFASSLPSSVSTQSPAASFHGTSFTAPGSLPAGSTLSIICCSARSCACS